VFSSPAVCPLDQTLLDFFFLFKSNLFYFVFVQSVMYNFCRLMLLFTGLLMLLLQPCCTIVSVNMIFAGTKNTFKLINRIIGGQQSD
jgi:uncharacterized membrane protein